MAYCAQYSRCGACGWPIFSASILPAWRGDTVMNPGNHDPVAVAIFAKAPVPGSAKTRLIPRLGAERAASLHTALVKQTVAAAVAADIGPVSLWCWPNREHPLFRRLAREHGLELAQQRGRDLGERMQHCLAMLCRRGPAVLIGTDCPVLDASALRSAAAALRRKRDAVFLPTEDGGYVLIGLRAVESSLFEDMPWSSPEVMAVTRQRLARLGWRWDEPRCLWDVDRAEDIERMRRGGFLDEWFAENGA